MCALVDTLMDLPELRKQHKLLMLRRSIQQKLRHLPRTVELHVVSGAIALLERRVRAATLHIVDITEQQLPEEAALQLGLPLHHGGLGILEMTPEEALAALLSSAAQAQAPSKKAARLLQVFDRVRGEQLRAQWSALVHVVDGAPGSEADFRAADDCLWTEQERASTGQVIENTLPISTINNQIST